MAECLAYSRLNKPTAAFDLPHQHCSLHRGDAEVGEGVFIGVGSNRAPCLLPNEKRSQLAFDNLKDQAEILADELVILRDLVADCAERTSALHSESLLQCDLCHEPSFQVVPRFDVVLKRRGAGANGLQVRL